MKYKKYSKAFKIILSLALGLGMVFGAMALILFICSLPDYVFALVLLTIAGCVAGRIVYETLFE